MDANIVIAMRDFARHLPVFEDRLEIQDILDEMAKFRTRLAQLEIDGFQEVSRNCSLV